MRESWGSLPFLAPLTMHVKGARSAQQLRCSVTICVLSFDFPCIDRPDCSAPKHTPGSVSTVVRHLLDGSTDMSTEGKPRNRKQTN